VDKKKKQLSGTKSPATYTWRQKNRE